MPLEKHQAIISVIRPKFPNPITYEIDGPMGKTAPKPHPNMDLHLACNPSLYDPYHGQWFTHEWDIPQLIAVSETLWFSEYNWF